MSRIGKKPIKIAEGVKLDIQANKISVSGPKGSLEFTHALEVTVKIDGDSVIVDRKIKTKKASAIWGTTAKLIENMIEGVKNNFQKQLELNGVGFRMALQGKKINMALGFSHPVEVAVSEGIEAKIEGNVMTISGADKQKVGQFAARIRALKPAEPYKGKGFKYVGEIIRRKEGKKATSSE